MHWVILSPQHIKIGLFIPNNNKSPAENWGEANKMADLLHSKICLPHSLHTNYILSITCSNCSTVTEILSLLPAHCVIPHRRSSSTN